MVWKFFGDNKKNNIYYTGRWMRDNVAIFKYKNCKSKFITQVSDQSQFLA